MPMSADNLKNNLSDISRVHLWEVVFAGLVGDGDADSLELRCQATSVPGRSFGDILIPFKASAGVQFPGKLTMSHQWNTMFVEGIDHKVFDAILSWKETIVNAKTGIGTLDSLIKKDIYLRLQDPEGNVTHTIKMVGCYPRSMDDVPLTYDDNRAVFFNVSFSFDYWVSE